MSYFEQMQHLLSADHADIVSLIRVLEQEKVALEKNDPDSLETIVNEKRALLAHLENSDQQRQALLSQAGYPHNKQGMMDFLNSEPTLHNAPLKTLWKQLEVSLKQCRRQNKINQLITQASHLYLKELIRRFRGLDCSGEVYSKQGSVSGLSQANQDPLKA